jgi:oxygen-dependent protoporphyrinogen oxidase
MGATMPRFLQMESDHGSLIRGMWKQRKHVGRSSQQSSGARYSQFVAPRLGMSAFVQAIAGRLANADICLQSPVERMQPSCHGGWTLTIGGAEGRTVDVDGLILATPARPSSQLLQECDSELAYEFARIQYGSCALVSLGFRRGQVGHALDGFGCVVPAVEGRRILSVSFSSIKYAERAPDDAVLLRVFVGGARQSELLKFDDAALKKLVLEELNELLAIRGDPILSHVTRQMQAMPQYQLGHEQIVQRIVQQAEKLSNFALAGNALCGIGVPNCIRSGELAAESVSSKLSPARDWGVGSHQEKGRL